MVEGVINCLPFRAALEPDGEGSHGSGSAKPCTIAAGADAGDAVTVEITRAGEEPELRMQWTFANPSPGAPSGVMSPRCLRVGAAAGLLRRSIGIRSSVLLRPRNLHRHRVSRVRARGIVHGFADPEPVASLAVWFERARKGRQLMTPSTIVIPRDGSFALGALGQASGRQTIQSFGRPKQFGPEENR